MGHLVSLTALFLGAKYFVLYLMIKRTKMCLNLNEHHLYVHRRFLAHHHIAKYQILGIIEVGINIVYHFYYIRYALNLI